MPIIQDRSIAGISLLEVAGHPAVAYRYYYNGASSGDLLYRRAQDASGSVWTDSRIVDDAGDVGAGPSMTIVQGNPAISYADITNGNLKYARAGDGVGNGGWTSVSVVSASHDISSLAVVNGRPAIAYMDYYEQDLWYVWADNAQGTSWGAPIFVDGVSDNVGYYAQLVVVGDRSAIAYYNNTAKLLMYAYPRTD